MIQMMISDHMLMDMLNCTCITVKEALKHMIVRLYYEWLKGEKHESKGISSAG